MYQKKRYLLLFIRSGSSPHTPLYTSIFKLCKYFKDFHKWFISMCVFICESVRLFWWLCPFILFSRKSVVCACEYVSNVVALLKQTHTEGGWRKKQEKKIKIEVLLSKKCKLNWYLCWSHLYCTFFEFQLDLSFYLLPSLIYKKKGKKEKKIEHSFLGETLPTHTTHTVTSTF